LSKEAEVKDIALQLLDILVYLHSLSPPVIHRDIKPQNIIRNRQEQIYLVDFGAVQAVYRNTISIGGTFVGTLGYMSPEQLRGNVVPASDLYSLGCSLIFLLTGKLPTDLPQKRMKLDFRSQSDVSGYFADWLNKLLEPEIGDRFDSASIALTALKSKRAYIQHAADTQTISCHISRYVCVFRPTDSKIRIQITSRGAGCGHYFFLLFGIMWTFFSLLSLQTGGLFSILMGLGGIITSVLAVAGIWYLGQARTTLEINSQQFNLQWTTFSLGRGIPIEEIRGLTSDIDWVNLNIDKKRKQSGVSVFKNSISIFNTCAISEGDRQHKFGLGYNLSLAEAEKITQEISTFLRQLRS